MAVIKDVAQLAGVSKSTVSKFLNNPDQLSQDYRVRVEKAVNELNFVPSNIARSMRTKKTNQIAMIVPDIANPFYSELFSEMRAYAMQLGYRVIVYTTEDDLHELEKYIDNIDSIFADGIIICFLDEDEIIKRFDELRDKIPVTFVSWDIHRTSFNSVVVSLNDSIYRITKYMTELGYERIAFINGPADSRISKEKFSGFSRALHQANLKVYDEYITYGRNRLKHGYRNASVLMQLNEPPQAIIAANDHLALGCIKYLTQHNYRVPEDIAVTGHDGVQMAYIFDPSITTQAMPIQEMCKSAVDMLINKIEKSASKNRQAIFTTTLVEGKSTNPNAPNIIDL
ncbi:MAG: LacI family DNA-binding transcriptional regulator [Clostridia bacterium]|jgi:DNA-binding LacI/PurR family transcriptional regulator|nr:LacI family DNA-binding transcriptional regulator [Clostridia bacterium]